MSRRNPGVTQNSTTEEFIESEMQAVPTVEEAMQEWNDLKESSRCYEVYSNFPPEIMQALFEKLGTQEPVKGMFMSMNVIENTTYLYRLRNN